LQSQLQETLAVSILVGHTENVENKGTKCPLKVENVLTPIALAALR
jgi:hypothetical protein